MEWIIVGIVTIVAIIAIPKFAAWLGKRDAQRQDLSLSRESQSHSRYPQCGNHAHEMYMRDNRRFNK